MAAFKTFNPLLALAFPVLAGLGWMASAGAPVLYLAVNATALLIALAAARWLPVPRGDDARFQLALACLALLWFTALAGISIDGVRRWIGIGPLALHSGYLVLPLVVTLAARLPGWRMAMLLAAAALATVIQPDRAACYALAAASVALALHRQERWSIAAMLAGLICALLVLRRPDPLAPVRFVEGVQADAWAAAPAIGAVLVLAALATLALLRGTGRTAMPLALFMTVAGLSALAGTYPSILIGYSAAPILGFGLALAADRVQ